MTEHQNNPTAPLPHRSITPPSFWRAVGLWLKLGFISFGGPGGILALLHTELVERKRWISERRFLHALNYCMLLPGPTAQQLAIYIGWLLHGVRGGIAAGVLLVLPSFFIIVTLASCYAVYGQLPALQGVLGGFKPAVLAVIVFALVTLGRRTLTNGALISLAVAAFVAIAVLHVPFPIIIIAAGIVGALGGWLKPNLFQTPPSPSALKEAQAVLADHDESAPHARPSWWRAALTVIVFLVLWSLPIQWASTNFGRYNIWTTMAHFFTKAAFVTFGGGYAVLAYVAQAAVDQYQWVTAAQMMDGLALGETTPGPLIMVLTFVGFLGGWQQGNFAWPGAGLAALFATYYTFLPSFLFILLGGPFVEAMRGQLRFTAPLTAITAAVGGVILNLAFFFGSELLFPAHASINWFAAALSAAALLAVWRFKVGIATVVLACGLTGMIYQLALH
jgi:chromate transporter